jgi:hypothetical protein
MITEFGEQKIYYIETNNLNLFIFEVELLCEIDSKKDFQLKLYYEWILEAISIKIPFKLNVKLDQNKMLIARI